jgi:hypothetical protein
MSNSSPLSSSVLTGRPSIPGTAVRKPRGRRILDARLRGHDGGVEDMGSHLAALCARALLFVSPSHRTEGAGKAGCWLHPWVPCNKKHGGRTTGQPKQLRLSLRDGVTAYFVLSPVTGLFCHRHPQRCFHPPELSASVGAPGPHDFAVRVTCSRQSHASRPPHLTATFVTIASRPSFG